MSQRTELPRCQYPVPDRDRVDEDDCGEPAVAVWTFETGGQMYVCQVHDGVVALTATCQAEAHRYSFRKARGVIPYREGQERSEDIIRRGRGGDA